MKPKEEVLKELLSKGTQTRQVKSAIKLVLQASSFALTLSELHCEMQHKGYFSSVSAIRMNLWRMSKEGKVLVSVSEPRHYFVI